MRTKRDTTVCLDKDLYPVLDRLKGPLSRSEYINMTIREHVEAKNKERENVFTAHENDFCCLM